jgi:hypothetical protein
VTEDRERQEGQEVIQGGAQKKLGAGSEQKLQVHKVREGSAVGSSGELPWGRTLMCARIRTAVKALTGPRATCGGGSLLLVRQQGGVLPSVLWLSEGVKHPASSPRQRWRRQQGRVASTVGYQGTGCWGRPGVPDRVQVPRGGMERGSTSRVQPVHSPARYISKTVL